MNSRLVPVNGVSVSNSPAGHHRQKMDLIRSSLRPFEQHKWEVEMEEDEEGDNEVWPAEAEEEAADNGRKADMVRALVETGYDQESAFYALKLVNFRSVMDAIQVLAGIKKNLMQQHAGSGTGGGGGIALVDSPHHRPLVTVNGTPWPSSAQHQQQLAQAKSLPQSATASPNNFLKKPAALSRPAPFPGQAFKQSQSFGPADQLHGGASSRPLGTVIRVERNQSERLERRDRIGVGITAPGQHQQQGTAVRHQKQKSPPVPSSTAATPGKLHPTTSLPSFTPCPPSTSSSSPPPHPMLGSPQPVQRIFIDPQQHQQQQLVMLSTPEVPPPPNYGQFMDQMSRRFDAALAVSPPPQPVVSSSSQHHPHRSVSPLPESVAKRLKAGTYERGVRPCRAPMFRFFMEQHIEKLSQQNQERQKRAMQLSHEMEAAGLADNVKDNMLRLLRQKESKYLRMRRQKMNRSMFELIRHIGIGAFGKVTLVRKRDTDQIYAMKTLVKADVIQKQQAAHVKAERDILAEANSPWIVKLFFSFQDTENLYFIMEYVPGGDMMQLLINMGVFPESLARFYTAELCLAVEYVHSLGFIHRDIKPDNILIDKGGHIKLTDFGLCTGLRWTHDKRHYMVYEQQNGNGLAHLREDSFSLPPGLDQRVKLLEMRQHRKRERAHSVVGTGNYMAPEVIQRTGHTQLCDWWSVGVILYEMVYGRPPFMSQRDDPAETQYMIVHWHRFLDLNNPMGARLSRACVDCIARLCCNQEVRLGHRHGAKDIKGHGWFKGIDFANLRSSTPEYVPRVRHPEDTSNFDTFEVRSDEQTRGADAGDRAGPSGAPNFFDFTFRHFFSEGTSAAKAKSSKAHQQQRPSLAPLMTAAGRAAPTTSKVAHPALYSPPAARTVLQIGGGGGPTRLMMKQKELFRPFQARLDEDADEEAEESQC